MGCKPSQAGSCGEQADPTLPAVLPVPPAPAPLSSLCPSTSCPDKPPSQSPWELPQKLLSWISPAWEGSCPCRGCSGLCRNKVHAQMSRGFACPPWPQQQWKCVSGGRASSCLAFPAHKAKKTKPTQSVSPGPTGPSPDVFYPLFLHHPPHRAHTKHFWSLATLKGTQSTSEPPEGPAAPTLTLPGWSIHTGRSTHRPQHCPEEHSRRGKRG